MTNEYRLVAKGQDRNNFAADFATFNTNVRDLIMAAKNDVLPAEKSDTGAEK